LRGFFKPEWGHLMAGIVFPSIANALVPLMQMDQQKEQLSLQRQDRADNMAFRKEEADYRHKHLDEQRAMRIQTQLAGMDEKKRAMVKDFATFRVQYGNAVLNMPPEQQPQGWAMLQQAAKDRGFDPSLFAGQWSPETRARLEFDTNAAKDYSDTALPALGGGAPAPGGPMPSGGGGGYSPSAFMQGRIKRGDDPVTAAAWAGNVHHESTFDPKAFNPKDPNGGSHGLIQWNGPRAQALRQFAASRGGDPADPELQQDFLQSEIDADPQFKAQLAAAPTVQDKAALISLKFIRPADGQNQANLRAQTATKYAQAGGGPQYTMGTMPPSWEARGANAAPMPGPPAGLVPPGPPPAAMPDMQPRFAQAGGSMPPNANGQGGGEGPDVMGSPAAPAAPPHFDVRTKLHEMIPGARLHVDKTGMPLTNSQGLTRITYPNGQVGFVAIPVPPKKGEAGPFGGTGMDQQAHRIVLEGMQTGRTNTPEYAAAHAHISAERILQDPSTGGITRIKPNVSWATPPSYGNNQVPQPGIPPESGSKTVTVEPGKGKPLDNSARDDLTKASGGVLELTELVKSFDPTFGGYTLDKLGDASNFAKRNLPDALGGADPKGQAQWWQRYDMFANLERNKLFGSALTPGETAAFKAAMVSPGMKPEQIKSNLSRQQEIASKALSRIANSMKAGGYNQEAIEAATGIRLGDMPDPIGSVPQGPPPGGPADKAKQQFDLKKKYGLD
jgi:hypothetical protein